MKYKIIVEYEVEFNIGPKNLRGAIENALRIQDTEMAPTSMKNQDWSAVVILRSKTLEEVP